MAISLDIVNAFNSLPWDAIKAALIHHRVPVYLQSVLADYLSDRSICYPGRYGNDNERAVQGSVLGPLLWNLAYDTVLGMVLPPGVSIVCYADDTLVLSEDEETLRLAETGVARIVSRICGLGLRIAPQKTEALWFHGLKRVKEPPSMSVRVGDAYIQVGRYMKYP